MSVVYESLGRTPKLYPRLQEMSRDKLSLALWEQGKGVLPMTPIATSKSFDKTNANSLLMDQDYVILQVCG